MTKENKKIENIDNKSEKTSGNIEENKKLVNLEEVSKLIEMSGENLLPKEQVAELRTEVGEIIDVDEASIERTQKILDRARLIDKLEHGEDLLDDERNKLGSYLHERGWHAVFSELKTNDKLVYFSSPGGEFSVKSFNTVFGEQSTDSFIAKRGQVLFDAMDKRGLNVLNQDYRSGMFKLDSKIEVDNFEKMMNDVGSEINNEMSSFVKAMIEDMVEEGNPKEKYVNLEKLLDNENGGSGFRMNFGSSTVGEQKNENDLSHIISSLTECAQVSQISRRIDGDSYGSEFSKDLIFSEVYEINELGQDLMDTSVKDEKGIDYKVFSSISNRRVMNRDLLRLIRKGEFQSTKESEDISKKVDQYIRRINLLDLVKPMTAKEAQDGTIKNKIDKVENFLEKDSEGQDVLKKDMSQEEKKNLAHELRNDQKDNRYDSSEFFHSEAMKLDNCVYINVDVLDLGVDLLLEYEHLLQDIQENPDELDETAIQAGDRITESMRIIRGHALNVFSEHFPDLKHIGKPGGDEISFAMENEVDSKKMEEFLLDLQKTTGTRVIKTSVGTSERHSSKIGDVKNDDEHKDRLVEHLAAVKRAERGSDLCKKIEKNIRNLELLLENKIEFFDSENNDEYKKIIDKKIEDFGISKFKNIAVKENYNGDFLVICREEISGDIEEISFDKVIDLINKKINTITQ